MMLFVGLAACSTTETATFSCPNGPEIAVTYADDAAYITFRDGRTEVLPSDPSRVAFYAKPGMSWSETSFRTGRLNTGGKSYSCDQSSI
jgi:hypothetical protein